MNNFKFELGQAVSDKMTQRVGTIEGRAEYRFEQPGYFFHYLNKQGENCTEWISEDRLEPQSL